MGARQMGYFTQSEWQKGLTELECDSVAKVQSKLENLNSYLNDPNTFKNIYRYAYDFARVSWVCHIYILYILRINFPSSMNYSLSTFVNYI